MRHTENPPGSPPGGFSMNAPVSRLGGPSSGNPASVTVHAWCDGGGPRVRAPGGGGRWMRGPAPPWPGGYDMGYQVNISEYAVAKRGT